MERILAVTGHALDMRAVDRQPADLTGPVGTRLLADRGHHRAPAVPDLLIAATADLAGLVVLHVDKDFDLIADVTGQEVQRLALV